MLNSISQIFQKICVKQSSKFRKNIFLSKELSFRQKSTGSGGAEISGKVTNSA